MDANLTRVNLRSFAVFKSGGEIAVEKCPAHVFATFHVSMAFATCGAFEGRCGHHAIVC